MSLSKPLIAFTTCALIIGASGVCAWASEDPSEVVAEIGGKKITRAEFEQKESAKLLSARYKYYQSERQALDDMIDDEVLKQQADREHVSVDQLLENHVRRVVAVPTDEQLRVFYEGMKTDQPYEAVKDQIRESLLHVRTDRAETAYIKSLREQDSAQILLAPPRMNVQVGDAPVRGPRNAPVTVIEFADYQCPYCQKINPDLKRLDQDFPGKIAFVFKDFPLPIHNHAAKAAEASRCARDQGKYWEYHDLLFENKELDKEQLDQNARELKLDQARFDSCLASGKEAAGVEKDVAEGTALGITQTPGFFVNGHFFLGALPYATLRDLIQQQLAAADKAAGANTRASR
ncbi:MAG: thioredoxin domain-containing protein [Acidobacteriaceae bacterium]|nr:thioredoxin domain-containing protein [Acidobacteriaceae bacterium]MBV8571713.1 thioredoxin domain-containing protein [Acidobacteriaceae bacterium]